jgi:hypothetical protein
MSGNVQSGLVLVGVSAALLYAWWSGALTLFIEQAMGRAAPQLAGGGAV